MRRSDITTVKVLSEADRASAVTVLARVYREEKKWLSAVDLEIPVDGGGHRTSWFLTRVKGEPAGVIRLCYDPPLEAPAELDFHFEQEVDLAGMAGSGRFVDIGRFMILPQYRSRIPVVLQLMSAAVREVVDRGYTHFITDVFESDPHSPLRFHTRVLGFERIGTHRFGELAYEGRRIVLVLDIARAYLKLKARKDRVFRELTGGLQEILDGLAARRGLQPAA